MTTETVEKILIVDDDFDHLELVRQFAKSLALDCSTAKDGLEAIELLKNGNYCVVVTDMVMPNVDGMKLLEFVKENYPETDVVIMTGYYKNFTYVDVIKAGASDFISKPFYKDEFIAKLDRLFRERRLLHQLQKAKLSAEHASKAKTDFMNTISHELRTPMNGIIGFTNMLSGTNLNSEQEEFLDMVRDSSDRLMSLIDHLLEFSEIAKTKKDSNDISFNLQEEFESLIDCFLPKAKEKELGLTYTIDDSLPKELIGDHNILVKVISNLIDNSIKFTENGDILIGAETKENFDGGILLQVYCKDTGCGISLDKQKVILEEFVQAENYMTREHQGAGLGLAICSKLLRMVGGEIWVQSELNKGAIFYFIMRFGVKGRNEGD